MLSVSRNNAKLSNRCIMDNPRSQFRQMGSSSLPKKNKTAEINLFCEEDNAKICFTPRINRANPSLLNYCDEVKIRRPSLKTTHKSVEELLEENWELKNRNNFLVDELNKMKVKTESRSKWSSERVEQYNLEFEKELYWGGSKTYLISGIKCQYHKLRKRFEQQEIQLQEMKKENYRSKIPELQVEVRVLQEENLRLSDIVRKVAEEGKNKVKIPIANAEQKFEVLYVDLEEKNKKLEKEISELNSKISEFEETIEKNNKKMEFLEKVIIEKDNKEFHASRKIKSLEKINSDLKEYLRLANDELASMKKAHEEEKSQLFTKSNEEKQKLLEGVNEEIKILKEKISDLSSENSDLKLTIATLKQRMSSPSPRKLERRKSSQSSNNSFIMGKRESMGPMLSKMTSIEKRESMGPMLSKMTSMESAISPIHLKDPIFLINQELEQSECENSENEEEQSEEQKSEIIRYMQTADKKYSDSAKRVRKVSYNDVEFIGQILKYKMIKSEITGAEMKRYFERRTTGKTVQKTDDTEPKTESKINGKRKIEWEDEYTNMREVKQILQSYPFSLPEPLSHFLSRYTIENCEQEFVYEDLGNENLREIVKSVIYALVGEFSLGDKEINQELESFIMKNGNNFHALLKSSNPHGRVSKKKVCEILKDLEVELSENAIELMMAKMFDNEYTLEGFKYEKLFEK